VLPTWAPTALFGPNPAPMGQGGCESSTESQVSSRSTFLVGPPSRAHGSPLLSGRRPKNLLFDAPGQSTL